MSDKYLFVSAHEFDLDLLQPVSNRHSKPTGGLWTSAFDPDTGSEWLQSPLCYFIEGTKGYVLRKRFGARILEVGSVSESLDILDKYCIEKTTLARKDGTEYALGHYVIDFESMAKEFDAIHVSRAAARIENKHNGKFSPFSDWSVDSTLWFNTKYLSLVEIIDYKTLERMKSFKLY